MSRIQYLEKLITKHREQYGVSDPRAYSVVVPPDSAVLLLREIFVQWPNSVTVTEDPDEIFCILGTPLRLRYEAPPGEAWIFERALLPERKCCDRAAYVTAMMMMTRGNA